ncbi:MAG: hypothetical protein U7123_08700 [Potamolinea sp.]
MILSEILALFLIKVDQTAVYQEKSGLQGCRGGGLRHNSDRQQPHRRLRTIRTSFR